MARVLSALLFLLAIAAPAAGNEYRAERFDSRIEVLRGGSLRVTETIVFRFEDGTFTRVFRRIPTRRTDGIEFVSAAMDGQPYSVGTAAGTVNIRRKEGVQVEWVFAPRRGTTHTFVLTYLAHGVTRMDEHADVVGWRALPSQHEYAIEQSRIEVVLPAKPASAPRVNTRRVAGWDAQVQPDGVVVTAHGIRKNGWLELFVSLPKGAVLNAPPAWQQRQIAHGRYRNPSLIAASIILFAGLVLLFAIRQGYDPPPREQGATGFSGPPDPSPPAIAGTLVSNGQPQLEHALATLFALASRGALTVQEEAPGRFSQRNFLLVRGVESHLAAHERVALDTIFSAKAAAHGRVPLSKARSHLEAHFKPFREAVQGELAQAGMLDADRQAVRARYTRIGVILLVFAILTIIPVGLMFPRFGRWPLLAPGAIMIVSVLSLIFGTAHTPLSNEGVRKAGLWRAYRKHLREMPSDGVRRESWDGTESPSHLLPFAVALGLGSAWAKLYKDRGAPLPPWFHAASAADSHPAFVAFIGTGGAGAHGSGGGGGGGAAGGGASGAS